MDSVFLHNVVDDDLGPLSILLLFYTLNNIFSYVKGGIHKSEEILINSVLLSAYLVGSIRLDPNQSLDIVSIPLKAIINVQFYGNTSLCRPFSFENLFLGRDILSESGIRIWLEF